MNARRQARLERLEFELDLRLTELYGLLHEYEYEREGLYMFGTEPLMCFLRSAWASGYWAALTDPNPEQLLRELGYKVPTRRRP